MLHRSARQRYCLPTAVSRILSFLWRISPLVLRIARALELSTRASNANGSTVNNANTGLQRSSPPAKGVRVHRRSLSHKIAAPPSKKVAPLGHQAVHRAAKNLAERGAAAAEHHLQVGPTCRGCQAPQHNCKALCSVNPVPPQWETLFQVESCGQPAHVGKKAKNGK